MQERAFYECVYILPGIDETYCIVNHVEMHLIQLFTLQS